MKKIKLLTPLGIATLATAMMPLVSCGCKDKDDVYYIDQKTQNNWLQSKRFNIKKGDELKFSFKWSDAKSLTPAAEDNYFGWGVECCNVDDPTQEDIFYADPDLVDVTLTVDGKTLEGKDDMSGDYFAWGGLIAPTESWELKDNSVIEGSVKITRIWRSIPGALEDEEVDEANNVLFILVTEF